MFKAFMHMIHTRFLEQPRKNHDQNAAAAQNTVMAPAQKYSSAYASQMSSNRAPRVYVTQYSNSNQFSTNSSNLQYKVGLGRVGSGGAGQGRAGQGRAGQGAARRGAARCGMLRYLTVSRVS